MARGNSSPETITCQAPALGRHTAEVLAALAPVHWRAGAVSAILRYTALLAARRLRRAGLARIMASTSSEIRAAVSSRERRPFGRYQT